jgi:hypothetical protein
MIGYLHRQQSGVGHRAANERDLAHIRKLQIGDILSASVQEAVVLLSPNPSAYTLFAAQARLLPSMLMLRERSVSPAPAAILQCIIIIPIIGCKGGYYLSNHRNNCLRAARDLLS